MAYESLRDFIDRLESQRDLVRVAAPVNTALEITEIQTRRSPEWFSATLGISAFG